MKRLFSVIVALFVVVSLVYANPFLPNPPLGNNTHSSETPSQWIYDLYGNLVGSTNKLGTDMYFAIDLSNGAAPVMLSGFGATVASAVLVGQNPRSFKITTAAGVASTTGVITMPAAPNGWSCAVNNQTPAVYAPKQTANTTTSVTIGNYSTVTPTSGVAWVNTDVLNFNCAAF